MRALDCPPRPAPPRPDKAVWLKYGIHRKRGKSIDARPRAPAPARYLPPGRARRDSRVARTEVPTEGRALRAPRPPSRHARRLTIRRGRRTLDPSTMYVIATHTQHQPNIRLHATRESRAHPERDRGRRRTYTLHGHRIASRHFPIATIALRSEGCKGRLAHVHARAESLCVRQGRVLPRAPIVVPVCTQWATQKRHTRMGLSG